MAGKPHFQTVFRAQPWGLPRPIVLIVDAEAVAANTRAMILEQSGISAMVAYDGKSALEIAHATPPDLLLAGVAIPGMNGVDLAMAIRQIIPDCSILLFPGQTSTADLLDADRTAGQPFTILTKPLGPAELVARVSETLELGVRDKESAHLNVVADQDQECRPPTRRSHSDRRSVWLIVDLQSHSND